MKPEPLKLLIADATADPGGQIGQAIADSGIDISAHWESEAAAALTRLAGGGYDCALFDAGLHAFESSAAFEGIRASGIETPIVLVTDPDEHERACVLLSAGAADCLIRQELTGHRLVQSVLKAVRLRKLVKEHAEAETLLHKQPMHDQLTRLPNRLLFYDRLDRALATARRERKPVALLLLDLNDFNAVNQTLGHTIGDRVLEVAGSRLMSVLRTSDSLGRIGDDEFAVLLPTGATLAGALTTANKMRETMNKPFMVDENRFTVGSAIGIALHPLHGATADELLRCAESAVRSAKRDSVGFAVYSGDDGRYQTRQLSLAHDLREAIGNEELLLHYQPRIDISDARVCGVEALVRWRHPRQGLLFPDTFIPVAEQIGVIEGLTRWVMAAALQQVQDWRRAGLDLTVSVNLSALSLHNRELPDMVQALLSRWEVPADRLVLEITESAIISHVMRATETLNRLHRLGVQIAIDDFGTGYTSLSNLRRLRVNELKVDKSFVMNMRRESDDSVIVRTIIELGRSLGLKVVAEGVEDAETLQLLKEFGCEEAQGYYMSRPLEPQALERWIAESPWGKALARKPARIAAPAQHASPVRA